MVRIKKRKIIRVGGGYGILIPKALVECEVLKKDQVYDVDIPAFFNSRSSNSNFLTMKNELGGVV